MLFNQSHARKETLPSVHLSQRIDEFMWKKVFLTYFYFYVFLSLFLCFIKIGI